MSGSKFITIHFSLFLFFITFADCMNKGHKETISIRIVSCAFIVLALAIFCRWMMDRHRYKACEEENNELRNDLRRLAALNRRTKLPIMTIFSDNSPESIGENANLEVGL